MSKTMADLKVEVATRLRETLHGREIDTMERGMPELPHMLGIVTIGAISTPEAENGSLLDSRHSFWDDYYKPVKTKNAAKAQVRMAIQSLKDDGVFRVSTPYGEEAGIWYCEVDEPTETSDMSAVCRECGETLSATQELVHNAGQYNIQYTLDCPMCEFSGVYETALIKK